MVPAPGEQPPGASGAAGSRRRRAFLHIGLPKTGTTYLQQILWSSKADLAAAGILLPGRHRRRHLLASLDVREDPKLARRAGDVSAPWLDLVAECRDWPGDVVISHEFFAAASTAQVKRMVVDLEDFEVHAVVTARPMAELGLSRWQEWVKSGGQLGVDDYPHPNSWDPADEWGWSSFDLDSVLDRWGAVLTPERVHVLPMDRSRSARHLWLTFAEILGLDGGTFPVPAAPANPSLGLVAVELLRRVNPHLTSFTSAADRGNWIRGYLAEGGVIPSQPERFRAGPAKEAELLERDRLALERLRRGRYDVRGDLEHLEPNPVRGARHPSEVGDEELLAAGAETIANMLEDVRRLTQERDRAVAASERLARRVERLDEQLVRWQRSWAPPRLRRAPRAVLRRLRARLGPISPAVGRPDR